MERFGMWFHYQTLIVTISKTESTRTDSCLNNEVEKIDVIWILLVFQKYFGCLEICKWGQNKIVVGRYSIKTQINVGWSIMTSSNILGGHSFDERRPKLLGDCGRLALVELEHRLDDGDLGGRRVLKKKWEFKKVFI